MNVHAHAIRLALNGYDANAEAWSAQWASAMAEASARGVVGLEWGDKDKDGTPQQPGVICAGCAAVLAARRAEYLLARADAIKSSDPRVPLMRCAFEARHPAQPMVLLLNAAPSAKT